MRIIGANYKCVSSFKKSTYQLVEEHKHGSYHHQMIHHIHFQGSNLFCNSIHLNHTNYIFLVARYNLGSNLDQHFLNLWIILCIYQIISTFNTLFYAKQRWTFFGYQTLFSGLKKVILKFSCLLWDLNLVESLKKHQGTDTQYITNVLCVEIADVYLRSQ